MWYFCVKPNANVYMKSIWYIWIMLLPFVAGAQPRDADGFEGRPGRQVVFAQHPFQRFGFDDFYLRPSDDQPLVISGKNGFRYVVPYKSVSEKQGDVVYAQLQGRFDSTGVLTFAIAGDTSLLPFRWIGDTLAEVQLPARSLNYEVVARYRDKVYGKLKVLVYPGIVYPVKLVPVADLPVNMDTLSAAVNAVFQGANIRFDLSLADRFISAAFRDSTVFEDPDSLSLREYTDQMFALTRAYDQKHKSKPQEYRIFVISRFEDSLVHGFMGLGNHTGFVTAGDEKALAGYISAQLGRAIGFLPEYDPQVPRETDSVAEIVLSYRDWEQLRSGEAGHTALVEISKGKRLGAVAAYYFWEENADGGVYERSIHKPYKRNFIVTVSSRNQKTILPSEKVEFAVNAFMEDNSTATQRSSFEIRTAEGHNDKFQLPLRKAATSDLGSVIFKKVNGVWETAVHKNVLYFNVINDSVRKFSYSSDSLILSRYNVEFPANGHYVVHTYWKNNGKIARQEVYAYNGENVTKFFMQPEKIIPRRVMVFSNGYRGRARNKDISDNLVTSTDRYTYWLGIDKAFIKRLEPFETFYIDGNHDISTSGHRNMLNFGLSIAVVKTFASKNYYDILNSRPNEAGFNERREKGKIAGKAFLIARCNSPACMETIDTVDIVCHSMGYSYALGFIDAIKGKVVFGKIYIIAPENACVGGTDWSMFEEVWQYGSNLDQPDPDPVWEQDGIAPQCQVKGLETVPPGKGGRAFFPKDWPTKNFIDSHMLYNYFWMFDCIQKGENGYIGK